MTQKELKRLSRGDLLEMLLELSKENDQLRREVKHLRSQLEDRTIAVADCGSLAEAALKLNGVFQAAQAACEQYTENMELRSRQTQEQCLQQEQRTRETCEAMIADAQARARAILEEAQKKQAEQDAKYQWITELMESSEEA